MNSECIKLLNQLPKSYLLIVFPPHHHGNAIGRIISSHKEFYRNLTDCDLSYDNIPVTSPLTWPESVDHFGPDRAISEEQFTRKQALLGMYRRVHGGLFLHDEDLLIDKGEMFQTRALSNPGMRFTLLHHGNEQMNEISLPKLVVTDCEEGFREARQYGMNPAQYESLDYKSFNAEYHLDYRKLFSHDYNMFYDEYMNLVKHLNLTPNEDEVRGFVLRLLDRMKHCDEYLWKIMQDDGTLSEPYYTSPYCYDDLYSPVFRKFEAAYLHFIRLKELPYQMNAVRTRILFDLDKKNR
tara:strand:+ start:211 stop:1095 length:885 start_codon:yes stop_codon:yes gene_type:complete